MAAVDKLLDDIFDGQRGPLYAEFAGWVRGSRRFKAFASDYRAKLRAKLKHARDEGSLRDLRAELLTAALLLQDARFSLEYEAYAAARTRGPDFTVTFKTHTPFNVEVRRVRGLDLDGGSGGAQTGKLAAVLCDKVRQMPPSIVNLLWLVAEGVLSETDVIRAAGTLRHLAERKADDFFTQRGFSGAAGFLKHYQRLSAIVLGKPGASAVRLNPLARHQPPPAILTAIQRLKLPDVQR